jgi:hypothetical protein
MPSPAIRLRGPRGFDQDRQPADGDLISVCLVLRQQYQTDTDQVTVTKVANVAPVRDSPLPRAVIMASADQRAAVDSRIASFGGNSVDPTVVSPASWAMASRTAPRPISSAGIDTLVSWGEVCRAT